jgi:hypothetical protein
MRALIKLIFLLAVFSTTGYIIWAHIPGRPTPHISLPWGHAAVQAAQDAQATNPAEPEPGFTDIDGDGIDDEVVIKDKTIFYAHGLGEGKFNDWMPIMAFPPEIESGTIQETKNTEGHKTYVIRAWDKSGAEYDQFLVGFDAKGIPQFSAPIKGALDSAANSK